MSATPELALPVQEKEMHKDFAKEMQHARNEGGIDTKVLASFQVHLLLKCKARLPSTSAH